MRSRLTPVSLSSAAGLVLLWHVGVSGAQPVLATGPDAEVSADGLHRVHPSIMENAWVKPELDLSGYTRILLMPTAIQFREVQERNYSTFTRTKGGITEFAVDDQKKEWLRGVWRRAVEEQFAQDPAYELYQGAGADVLVVQAFLVDVVSHIPPDSAGSNYTLVKDPWVASVVLELRDGTTAELLARTVDRRYGEGLLDPSTVWMLTETLLERWALVLSDRLEQLSDLSGLSDVGRRRP